MKEFRKQHVMESKFHSFWTKSKCRLKNFVAALNQFSQFVQCVQIVGARVFEVMFSVTTVCLVQGRSHFPFLLHQWRSLKPPPPRLYPVFISIPIPQAAAPGPRSNRRKKPPPATTSRCQIATVPNLYPMFISIPISQAAAPGPRSNRRKKPPPATTSR